MGLRILFCMSVLFFQFQFLCTMEEGAVVSVENGGKVKHEDCGKRGSTFPLLGPACIAGEKEGIKTPNTLAVLASSVLARSYGADVWDGLSNSDNLNEICDDRIKFLLSNLSLPFYLCNGNVDALYLLRSVVYGPEHLSGLIHVAGKHKHWIENVANTIAREGQISIAACGCSDCKMQKDTEQKKLEGKYDDQTYTRVCKSVSTLRGMKTENCKNHMLMYELHKPDRLRIMLDSGLLLQEDVKTWLSQADELIEEEDKRAAERICTEYENVERAPHIVQRTELLKKALKEDDVESIKKLVFSGVAQRDPVSLVFAGNKNFLSILYQESRKKDVPIFLSMPIIEARSGAKKTVADLVSLVRNKDNLAKNDVDIETLNLLMINCFDKFSGNGFVVRGCDVSTRKENVGLFIKLLKDLDLLNESVVPFKSEFGTPLAYAIECGSAPWVIELLIQNGARECFWMSGGYKLQIKLEDPKIIDVLLRNNVFHIPIAKDFAKNLLDKDSSCYSKNDEVESCLSIIDGKRVTIKLNAGKWKKFYELLEKYNVSFDCSLLNHSGDYCYDSKVKETAKFFIDKGLYGVALNCIVQAKLTDKFELNSLKEALRYRYTSGDGKKNNLLSYLKKKSHYSFSILIDGDSKLSSSDSGSSDGESLEEVKERCKRERRKSTKSFEHTKSRCRHQLRQTIQSQLDDPNLPEDLKKLLRDVPGVVEEECPTHTENTELKKALLQKQNKIKERKKKVKRKDAKLDAQVLAQDVERAEILKEMAQQSSEGSDKYNSLMQAAQGLRSTSYYDTRDIDRRYADSVIGIYRKQKKSRQKHKKKKEKVLEQRRNDEQEYQKKKREIDQEYAQKVKNIGQKKRGATSFFGSGVSSYKSEKKGSEDEEREESSDEEEEGKPQDNEVKKSIGLTLEGLKAALEKDDKKEIGKYVTSAKGYLSTGKYKTVTTLLDWIKECDRTVWLKLNAKDCKRILEDGVKKNAPREVFEQLAYELGRVDEVPEKTTCTSLGAIDQQFIENLRSVAGGKTAQLFDGDYANCIKAFIDAGHPDLAIPFIKKKSKHNWIWYGNMWPHLWKAAKQYEQNHTQDEDTQEDEEEDDNEVEENVCDFLLTQLRPTKEIHKDSGTYELQVLSAYKAIMATKDFGNAAQLVNQQESLGWSWPQYWQEVYKAKKSVDKDDLESLEELLDEQEPIYSYAFRKPTKLITKPLYAATNFCVSTVKSCVSWCISWF